METEDKPSVGSIRAQDDMEQEQTVTKGFRATRTSCEPQASSFAFSELKTLLSGK